MHKANNKSYVLMKIILIFLVIVILVLSVILVIRSTHNNGNKEEIELTQQEANNEASARYEEGGYLAVIAYYDELVKGTNNKEMKLNYLKYAVESLDVFCGWECSDEILARIHEMYDLDSQNKIIDEMCEYDDFYADSDPIETCNVSSGWVVVGNE